MRFTLPPALLVATLLASDASGQEGAVAFRGATIETAAKAGRLENATLVLRDGKIEAVGKDVAIPDDARIIDAVGKTIMPSIVEPYRPVTVGGSVGDSGGARTIVIRGRTITLPAAPTTGTPTFVRLADVFYPYERIYHQMLRSGLTHANLVTTGYGQAAAIKLAAETPEQMMVTADGILFVSVTNETRLLDLVRQPLEQVARSKGVGGAAPPSTPGSGFGRRGPPMPSPTPTPTPSAPGSKAPSTPGGATALPPNLTPWIAVYEGKSPLLVSANNAAAILHVLALADKYKDVQWALLVDGQEVAHFVEKLKGKKVRLILRPAIERMPFTRDRYNAARLAHENGIEILFAGPSSADELLAAQDMPLFAVAMLVKTGLPRQTAIEGLTAKPAALLGIDKTSGTLEAGKAANLLLFEGDPLTPASKLRRVLLEGKAVYER